MRTTLTLDDALARRLKLLAAETGRSFKEVVNEALTRGLDSGGEVRRGEPYRLTPVSLGGLREGVDLTKAVALAAELEDEQHARELALRK